MHANSSTSSTANARHGARRSKKVDKKIGYGSCAYRTARSHRKQDVPGRKIQADQYEDMYWGQYTLEDAEHDSRCSVDEANQREIDDALIEDEAFRCLVEMEEVEEVGMDFFFHEDTQETPVDEADEEWFYFY